MDAGPYRTAFAANRRTLQQRGAAQLATKAAPRRQPGQLTRRRRRVNAVAMEPEPKPAPLHPAKTARLEREAAALRENLRRRKQQARDRQDAPTETPECP